MRALLVEDSATCQAAGEATLEALGYRVTKRSNESGARGAVTGRTSDYDLYVVDAGVLLDLQRDGGNGLRLAQWILRWGQPGARVIVWSADKSIESQALAIGAAFAWKEDKEALARAVRGA